MSKQILAKKKTVAFPVKLINYLNSRYRKGKNMPTVPMLFLLSF